MTTRLGACFSAGPPRLSTAAQREHEQDELFLHIYVIDLCRLGVGCPTPIRNGLPAAPSTAGASWRSFPVVVRGPSICQGSQGSQGLIAAGERFGVGFSDLIPSFPELSQGSFGRPCESRCKMLPSSGFRSPCRATAAATGELLWKLFRNIASNSIAVIQFVWSLQGLGNLSPTRG